MQGCATFIFCFLYFSLFTVHFAVAFSPSAAYLRQGYSGVPDANQAKGCLRWGERRQQGPRKLASWGARQASPLWRKAPSDATALPNASCPVSAV